ncbi:nucleoredoxin-like protein 1 isoform X2 [Gambusia affinis]|uniref:nucleoredoxin-like protein 1 isoform X2 n=1 Tax=Gambusia affinis TaxID=33528 RepID=UPI001CDD888E|nr:nucleoredoxin-like protein 1 isoform X2 [Gambusia affinis]
MVDLFLDRVLVENNSDQDELNTEREIIGILENRVLLLFFASAECEKCQSLDQSEEQQRKILKELHKRTLFLPFEDPYRKELQAMFKVKDVPAVVVLRPDGSVLSPNAVRDICRLGADCFRNWQESAELVERTFMLNEEFDDPNLRSATDPVRRLKYKTEDDKRNKRWWKLWVKGKNEEEKDEAWDMKRKNGDGGIWRKI